MSNINDFNEVLKNWSYPYELFEKYFNYQEVFLTKEINQISDELKSKIKDKEIEEQIHLENLYNEFYLDFLNGTFPDIQNKTSLVVLYKTFENNLIKICEILAKELNTPIEYSDLNGHMMEKCKKFLTKIIGLNNEIFNSENWKRIDCIREIRNNIVHNESDVSSILKKKKIIMKEFMKIEGFLIIDNRIGLIKNDFLKNVLIITKMFYNELIAALNNTQKHKYN